MRWLRAGILSVGLLYFPLFLGFMSYDHWLWKNGAETPAGSRVAAVHSHGQARYVRPDQAETRGLLQAATLVALGVFFLAAGWDAVRERWRRAR